MLWHPDRSRSLLPCGGLLWLLLLPVFSGCGYGLGTRSASIFSDADGALKTLKIKSVENPTLDTWLPYELRSAIRDEIAARRLAIWVDSGRADFELDIKVVSYTYRTWVYDDQDVSLLFLADMIIEATVYRGNSNDVVWRSGPIQYSDTYETLEERKAATNLLREIARLLADRMRQVF